MLPALSPRVDRFVQRRQQVRQSGLLHPGLAYSAVGMQRALDSAIGLPSKDPLDEPISQLIQDGRKDLRPLAAIKPWD